MRKINLLLANAAMVAALLLSSCKSDDEDETVAAVGPSVLLQSNTSGAITSDATVVPGTTITFRVEVTKGDKALSEFKFFKGSSGLSADEFTVDGKQESSNPFNVSSGDDFVISTTASSTEGTTLYQFQVTDKDGLVSSKSVTITTENASTSGAIATKSAKTLNNVNSNNESLSFIDLVTGSTYTFNGVTDANDQDIDLGFFSNTTDGVVFKAPSDFGFGTGNNDAKTWATSNNTAVIKTSLTVAQFDAMTDDSELTKLDFSTAGIFVTLKDEATAKSTIVGFKTVSGTIGVIKVTSATISGGLTGKVTFDIKVQSSSSKQLASL